MSGQTFDAPARSTADRFFNLNFTPGRYGSTGLSMAYQVGADMIVHGAAAVSVPTVIMRIFGKTEISLNVTCDAQLQLPNSDIMFVLDTTLSMGETNPGDSQSKIATLRQAVTNFYNTMSAVTVPGTQVRYGFVPYSSTVNVGMLLRRDWMVDNWTYQSRVAAEQEPIVSGPSGQTTTDYSPWVYISGGNAATTSTLPSENCVAPANSTTTTNSYTPYTNLPQPNGDVWRQRTATQVINGHSYAVSLSNGVCTLTDRLYTNYTQQRTETVKPNPNAGQTTTSTRYWWNYQPVSYPVSAFKGNAANGLMAGGSFVATINNNQQPYTVTWNANNACIEERQASTLLSGNPAYDMDVDLVPTTDDRTRWRPWVSSVVFARAVTNYANPTGWNTNNVHSYTDYVRLSSYPNDHAACPSAARKLSAITPSALTSYLNGLRVAGLTYHDVGFLWGLRLMSAQGLFASENATAPNGGSISRNLIFMTDGDTETNVSDYDAYGLSALDRRRSAFGLMPTNSAQDSMVESRLSQLCSLAKDQKNITVWVIAFGTQLTPLLSNCASDGRAFQANNAQELNDAFAQIAARISQLRVTR